MHSADGEFGSLAEFRSAVPALELRDARARRERFRETFVDDRKAESHGGALTLRERADGLGYDGYLWDYFGASTMVHERDVLTAMRGAACLFAMWDLHTPSRVAPPDYFHLPYGTVLHGAGADLVRGLNWLPEDLYVFDDSFEWACALTHESVGDDRYCLRCETC